MSFSEIIEEHKKNFESESSLQEMKKGIEEAILKQIIEANSVPFEHLKKDFTPKTSDPWSKVLEIPMYTKRYESEIEPKIPVEEWSEFVKAEYVEAIEALDENGSVAPSWVLVDSQGVIQPWKLIYSKNGPCWQCASDRGKFAPAFLDEGVPNKWGLYEREYVAEVFVSNKASTGAPGIVVKPALNQYFGREL